MKTNPNDSVYRSVWRERHNGYTVEASDAGLTKREYFAACAMQGLLSSSKPLTHDKSRPRKAQKEVVANYAKQYARSHS